MNVGQYILIADAGGTSTQWCLLDNDGTLIRDLNATPINVCVLSDYEINTALRQIDVLLESARVLHFYGAGCGNEEDCNRIIKQLREIGYFGELHIHSDMMGTARALFGNTPGIACILGTGSNSCLYDGEKITANITAMGYILGDEGSGAAIGKLFLKKLLRGDLPGTVTEKFFAHTGWSQSDIYEKVYREPRANKFLASLATFVHDNIDNPRVRAIVEEEFDNFFNNIICRYPNASNLPVSCIGSIAYYFDQSLRAAASRHNMVIDRIERSPIQGLLRYHTPLIK